MTDTPEKREFQSRMQRLEILLQGVERWADPTAQDQAREIVQALLDLHGRGLERILSHLAAAGEAGTTVLEACSRDDVAGGLLLLHGLHPLDLKTRVQQALEQVRPYLRSHGGNVELLGIHEGVVRLRLEGSCHGCPSSSLTMKTMIEEAILEKAPDALAVEVEGAVEKPPITLDGRPLVALTVLSEPLPK